MLPGSICGSCDGPAVLGVSLLVFPGAEIVGGNDFIAAFVSGLVFGNAVRDRCRYLFEFGEAAGQLLAMRTFLTFGAEILPETFGHTGPALLRTKPDSREAQAVTELPTPVGKLSGVAPG